MNGPKAWELDLSFDITFSDLGRSFHLTLRNGVLIYVEREPKRGCAAPLQHRRPLIGTAPG
ncbi:hypothetical protein GCM10027406_04980 [Leifsonia lichenia]